MPTETAAAKRTRLIEQADAKLEQALRELTFGRAAMETLRRPFTSRAVKWKTQTGTAKAEWFLHVCYIDARLTVERLNLVVPHLWSTSFSEPVERYGAVEVVCKIQVGSIARTDVGTVGLDLFTRGGDASAQGAAAAMQLKALRSDALKRAGVHFGIGVSLYAMPPVFLEKGQMKIGKDGKIKGPTPAGYEKLRGEYVSFLEKVAAEYFGPPLDHGDQLGSVGDVEADADALQGQDAIDETLNASLGQGAGPQT